MDLKNNPFALLGLSSRDDKNTITDQFEETLSEGIIDEHELIVAQQELMVSKTRLKAEISWFPNINPSKATELSTLVRESDYQKLREALPTLDGLSLANVSSYLLIEKHGTPEVLEHLFVAQDQFDTASILNDVNGNRALSGFPLVDQTLLEGLIASLLCTHVKAAMTYISHSNNPGILLSSLVKKSPHNLEITSFIADVFEKYESWVSTKLRYYEEIIKEYIEKMKLGASEEDSLRQITELLVEWCEYTTPLQMVYQAKGLEEKRSKEIFRDMRDICLWLSNERDDHALALAFAQSLRKIFLPLPSVKAQIEEDIQTLESLREERKKYQGLIGLIDKADEAMRDGEYFYASIMTGNFGPKGKGLAGELYQEFITAVKNTAGKENEDSPYLILLKLAHLLTHEKDKPRVADKLLGGMNRTALPDKVTYCIKTIKKNIRLITLLKSIIKIISIVPILGPLLRAVLIWSAQKIGLIKTLVGLLLVVLACVLIICGGNSISKPHSSYSKTSILL